MGTLTELFGRRGWHHEEQLLSSQEVDDLIAFFDQRREQTEKAFRAWAGEPQELSYTQHQARLPDYEARDLPPDYRNFLVGQFDLETRLHERILDLLSTPSLTSFIRRFCGSENYYLHYPPMIRFKAPGAKESLVPVHQDTAYNPHLKDFLTAWLPLTDIDDACGGVIVYTGSQELPESKHEASGAWANRSSVDLSNYERKHVHMKAGDLLLFAKGLFHESAPHTASHLRYSVDFRVIPTPEATSKSYYDPGLRKVVRTH